jgi:PAT family beta-lactamase induction signal transducer AmpG
MFSHYVKDRNLLAVLLLGFSSGLPLALTSATLQAWFTDAGVDILTIGALSLVGLPYVWKVFWAPVLDRFVPPLWGRRRGWIFIMQLGLCIALFILAQMNPLTHPAWIGVLALVIAFMSASQDIAIDAYRTDILLPDERGLGAAAYIFSYRIAMLVSGGLALVFAQHFGWRITYEIMAVLMGLSIFSTYFSPEIADSIQAPKTFLDAIVKPLVNLFQRDKIIIIILFILFYKFGDAVALALISNFLLHGVGFSLTAVGVAHKTFGLLATILGAFAGGALLTRLSLFRALFLFGLLQAFSNLMFMFLAIAGKNTVLMVSSIFIEAFCSGMGTAAFVAFLMALCDHRYTATQFACLSGIAVAGRVLIGPLAGLMVLHLGWIHYFAWSFVLSFPGIFLLFALRNRVKFNAEKII